MALDRIFTVNDFYDGPRAGIATFQGRPHSFECQFDEEADEWSDLYWLMEVSDDVLQADLEKNDLFGRWLAEYHAGRETIASHPCLVPDRPRYDELTRLIGDRLRVRKERAVLRRGNSLWINKAGR